MAVKVTQLNYIKQCMAFSENIEYIEISHILDFLRTIFNKSNSFFAINSAKFAIKTISI